MADLTTKWKSKSNVGKELPQLRVTETLIVGSTDVFDQLAGLTASAAELNITDGVTATAAEINTLDGSPYSATITPGAPDSGTVAIQLRDANGSDLTVRGSVFAYLSDDTNGDSIAATAPDGGVAIGSDGLLIPVVADKAFHLVSEADGDIDLAITESGTATWYLIVRLPNGRLIASAAIAFSA